MNDPRNQSYITYKQTDLGYMAILKNICGQYTMRKMEENFNEDNCIDACTVSSILDIIDKHTITLPSCDDCEYHEDIGVLPDGTCYCNFWNTVVETDGFCYHSKKATRTKVNWRQ